MVSFIILLLNGFFYFVFFVPYRGVSSGTLFDF